MISDWMEEAFKLAEQRRKEVVGFRIVIETEPNRTSHVMAELRKMGVRVVGPPIADRFIVADVRDFTVVEKIDKIEGVRYISYEKKFYPMAFGIDELFKRIAIFTDPLLSKLSAPDLKRLGYSFKPAAEIPHPIKAMVENIDVLRTLVRQPWTVTKYIQTAYPMGPPVLTRKPWRLVTYTRTLMDAPDRNFVNFKVGVIDSGISPHPATPPGTWEQIVLTVDIPADSMGHGEWTSSCAFGRQTRLCRYGFFKPVSQARRILHVKIFSAFGPCSGYQVMKAMEICAKKGAKVVNMSLGGTLTESVENDPECKVLDTLHKKYGTIFVVAAGNEDGKWEIGSPGAALEALTVAAMDWKTLDTSSYSSRGPQGKYYEKHQDIFEDHYNKYGDKFLKPDVAGIGGDRESQIVSAVTGWYDGIFDFIPEGYEMMIGTCVRHDTKIITNPSGVKEIKDIKPGDMVYTFDKGKLAPRKVRAVMSNGIKPVFRVKLQDREIYATANHPILVLEKDTIEWKLKWKIVEKLRKGDMIVCLKREQDDHRNEEKKMKHVEKLMDLTAFTVREITEIEPAGNVEVFDIEVEGSHNFIANGIVVHNSMATPHVAGITALLLQARKIRTTDDVKNKMKTVSEFTEKTVDKGWGLVKYSYWR